MTHLRWACDHRRRHSLGLWRAHKLEHNASNRRL